MPIRIKDKLSIKKLFGLTKGFGAFANNTVIKNNPQLLAVLTSKETRIKFKKTDKGIDSKPIIARPLEKQATCATATINACENKSNTATKASYYYKWQSENGDSYYKIYLQPNLFGHWSVTSEWGGLKKKNAFVAKIFDRYEEALDFINHLNLKWKQTNNELTSII